jgi:NADPH:quinone reductase
MRAFELRAYDGPSGLTLTDVPEPEAAADEALLEVHAIGVNFPDLLLTRGHYQHKPDLPAVPGCEIAGIIRQAPEDSRWSVGDRAAAFVWDGGFAEFAAVPPQSLSPVPEGVDFGFAAGMIVNYQTVHFALQRRARLEAGETVCVLGAAGGIGTAALQVARGLGARVIAGVADEGQIATAEEAGCDEALVLTEGFASELRRLTDGRGVDVVLDPLGDWLFDEAIRGLAPEGRLIVIGFAAGKIPELRVNRVLLRNISVVGAAFGAFLDLDEGLMTRQAESLGRMVGDGIVRPHISARLAFEELPAALEQLGRGQIAGKAVIELRA